MSGAITMFPPLTGTASAKWYRACIKYIIIIFIAAVLNQKGDNKELYVSKNRET